MGFDLRAGGEAGSGLGHCPDMLRGGTWKVATPFCSEDSLPAVQAPGPHRRGGGGLGGPSAQQRGRQP